MIPSRIRADLFDRLSVQTMRYVDAVPTDEATGLNAQVYEMVAEEFFINGSITSHSAVPELMAAMWCGGREAVLVEDRLDRATKEAISGVLSRVNDCPYCEDMLVSLVHSTGQNDLAERVSEGPTTVETSPDAEPFLEWTVAVANGEWNAPFPFDAEAFPEGVGSLWAFSYINRFSHVVMDGSPIENALGGRGLYRSALRFFGHELDLSLNDEFEPGRALDLVPPAESPADLAWAAGNPRLHEAYSRWIATVERHADRAIPAPVRELVERRVAAWDGETMPMSRTWLDEEVRDLDPIHRDLARFALLVALAPYQVDDAVVKPVLDGGTEARFVRALAWASLTGARRIATGIAEANPELCSTG